MVSALRRMDPSPRVGAEIGWQRRLLFRGGYASRSGGYGGPSLGVGYYAGTLAIDAQGADSRADVHDSYRVVNAAPAAYDASGTVAQWAGSCYHDVFAFKSM